VRVVDGTQLVGATVGRIANILAAAGIADASAEARDLVAVVAGQNRFWPSLHADQTVSTDVAERAQRSRQGAHQGCRSPMPLAERPSDI
jgi:hypothetical protein